MTRFRAALLPLCFAAACFFSACDESVYPFLETERYYTLYGYLDTGADTQFVRVIPIRRTVEQPPPGPTGATVTTEDLMTGEVVVWRDSVVTFNGGTTGNVFYAPFEVRHTHRYRITVTAPDGKTTTAETEVPRKRVATVEAPQVLGGGSAALVLQRVRWSDVDDRPARVQTWYRFQGTTSANPFTDTFVTYRGIDAGQSLQGVDWQVTVNFLVDMETVREDLGASAPLALYNMGMKIATTSDDWEPPGGVFDPDVLIQPGTFSNVTNGFGFFGSVAQHEVEWTLPRAVYPRLGLIYPGQ